MTNQTAMPELLPCPFCGNSASVQSQFGREYWAQCNDLECGATDGKLYGSEREVITAWNRRALSQPVLFQYRTRPAWRPEGEGWTEWTDCSAEAYKDHERLPLYNDWQTEVRKLYTAPPASTAQAPAPVPNDVSPAVCRAMSRFYARLAENEEGKAAQQVEAAPLFTPDHDGSPCGQCGATGVHLCSASEAAQAPGKQDIAAFEVLAKYQGLQDFTKAADKAKDGEIPSTSGGKFCPATYYNYVTELAYRVWANKGFAAPVQPSQHQDQSHPLAGDAERYLAALLELRNWFESERKSISKGNGSQWSIWQCEEQIAIIDAARAAQEKA